MNEMLPPIGSVSTLPSHGRSGIVVAARPLGEAEGGQQLVALQIKASASKSGHDQAPIRLAPDQPKALTYNEAGLPRTAGVETGHASNVGPTSAKRLDQLNATERADVAKLQQRDQQVRQEEKAHAAVAGDLAGPINYTYQRGPDGKQYAVGGSVSVQAKTVSGDPNEAKRVSGRLASAAHAATSPSAQDLATARMAYDFANRLGPPASQGRDRPGLDLSL